jgi:hypothetical protein
MTAWTSEPPREGWHVWIEWNGKRHVAKVHGVGGDPDVDISYPGTMCMWKSAAGAGCKRSTHPIPSPEVLAAMHEVCDLVAKWRELRASQRRAGAKAKALAREVEALMRLQKFAGAKTAAEAQRAAADESARFTTAYQAMQAGDVFDAALRALEEARRG